MYSKSTKCGLGISHIVLFLPEATIKGLPGQSSYMPFQKHTHFKHSTRDWDTDRVTGRLLPSNSWKRYARNNERATGAANHCAEGAYCFAWEKSSSRRKKQNKMSAQANPFTFSSLFWHRPLTLIWLLNISITQIPSPKSFWGSKPHRTAVCQPQASER